MMKTEFRSYQSLWAAYFTIAILVIFQIVSFVHHSESNKFEIAWVFSILLALTACYLPLRKKVMEGPIMYFWATWGAGGIGMLLGQALNLFGQHGIHQNHDSHIDSTESFVDMMISTGWTLPFMLFLCIPVCVLVCRNELLSVRTSWRFLIHSLSAFSMLAGMYFSMRVAFFFNLSLTPFEHHHFMVFGMAIAGTASYIAILYAMHSYQISCKKNNLNTFNQQGINHGR